MDPSNIENYLDRTAHGDDIDMAQWAAKDGSLPTFSELMSSDRPSSKKRSGSSSRARPEPSSVKRQHSDCDNCGANFNHVRSMQAHKRRFHGAPPTQSCKYCRGTFTNERQLRQHMKERHPGEKIASIKCENCGQKFGTRPALGNHKREFHDPPQTSRCKLCPATFAKASQVVLHHRAVHQKEVRYASSSAQCYVCGLLCRTDNIRRHVESMHEGETKVQCPDCKARFRTARQLGFHRRKMHK